MSDKQINIGVGADMTQFNTAMKSVANTMRSTQDVISSTSDKATKTVVNNQQTLVQAYRNTFKDAQRLAIQQGMNSQAFLEAASAAAKYKDEVEDVRRVMNASSPKEVWKVTSEAISGAVQIAQGMVGVMTLIGVKSESATRAIEIMMSLSSISSGIAGVVKLVEAYEALSIVIMVKVIPAMAAMTLETAVMTGGITLVTAAIAILVYKGVKWYEDLGIAAKQAGQEMGLQNEIYAKAFKGSKDDWGNANSMKPFSMKLNENDYIDLKKEAAEAAAEASKIAAEALRQANIKQGKLPVDQIASIGASGIGTGSAGIKHEFDKTNLDLKKGWEEINANNLKGMGEFKANFGTIINSVKLVKTELSLTMDEITNNVSSAIQATVNAAMTGGNVGKALATSLLSSMGDFLIKWGEQIMLVGLGAEALKVALLSLNGVTAIIVGGLMIAAGGVAKSMASNMASGNGGGQTVNSSNYGNGFIPNFQGTSSMINVGGVVRGNDIAIVTINTAHSNGRVRR